MLSFPAYRYSGKWISPSFLWGQGHCTAPEVVDLCVFFPLNSQTEIPHFCVCLFWTFFIPILDVLQHFYFCWIRNNVFKTSIVQCLRTLKYLPKIRQIFLSSQSKFSNIAAVVIYKWRNDFFPILRILLFTESLNVLEKYLLFPAMLSVHWFLLTELTLG